MSYVTGLDLSLTGSGVATITRGSIGHTTVDTQVIGSKPAKEPTLADRDHRLTTLADRVVDHARGAQLVVVEGPSLGSTGRHGHVWDRAALWWTVVHRLLALEVPVVELPPAVRARWATGKGNAGKTAVAVAVARMWPDVAIPDDNAADALALATIAAQQLGWVNQLARHRDALTTVRWPVAA
ncbi:hypothetical protein ACFXGA_06285 [Actinosynnema sp. NPDC059335]|uniref:hypothetical protein n=1 Tax=Actinosynnema sp. NPDC059335 TaxID=3346804 RepID=UPI00366CA344